MTEGASTPHTEAADELRRAESKMLELTERRNEAVAELDIINAEAREANRLLDMPMSEAKKELGLRGADYDEWRSQQAAAKFKRVDRQSKLAAVVRGLKADITRAYAEKRKAGERLRHHERLIDLGTTMHPFELLERTSNLLRSLIKQEIRLGPEGKVASLLVHYLRGPAATDRAAFEVGRHIYPELGASIEALEQLIGHYKDFARTKEEEAALRGARKTVRLLRDARRKGRAAGLSEEQLAELFKEEDA